MHGSDSPARPVIGAQPSMWTPRLGHDQDPLAIRICISGTLFPNTIHHPPQTLVFIAQQHKSVTARAHTSL